MGPTASGKSSLALAAARVLGDVEIVSVDSMQVYRGMDIGTAKPTAEERAEITHHCIDLADPAEEWTVVRFRDAVRDAIGHVEGRGRRALLVGGTGLYFRAVVDPLEFPGEDRAIRDAVEREGSTEALYAQLIEVDPRAAARIEPGNRRRVVRALEVMRLTGRAFSSFGPGLDEYGEPVFPVRVVGARWPRGILAERISARLTGMRERGLVDEVRRLLPQGLSRTARQAIGYAEVIDHLEGRCTLDEAFAQAERRTRRFARRQLKWFERDPRVSWLDLGGTRSENSEDTLGELLEAWSACPASA
ncbi:MAG: tRNA (adenosine(37)-N6)-dimethylallyltransferase MiaA [Actinobacteria bacterium]|nr:tRNA (adenosine(37)-N6)-dimethylallyltransferase MiaA [Actinomycetota bacterium]